MKRRWVIMLVVGCVMVVALVMFLSREREPVYEGKTLSEWIVLSQEMTDPPTDPPTPTPAAKQARDAVRHMGTNAIPFLLRWMKYEPSPWRAKIANRVRGYPAVIRDNFIATIFLQDRREERAWIGATGFELLGTNGVVALPELVKRIADQKAPLTAATSARALVYLGPSALPPLLAEATNLNNNCRSSVVIALSFVKYLGADAARAVPVLIKCLSDTNPLVRVLAARNLGQLQLEPEIVLPTLAQLVSTNAQMRAVGIDAIRRFGKQPINPAIPVVVAALNDPDWRSRAAATNALLEIAPEVLANTGGPEKPELPKSR